MSTATATSTETTATVAGQKLRILEGGAGTPIVTLHHSTGSVGFLPVHEQLAANHRVLVPDMPGYGQSQRPEWARDTRDLAILLNSALGKLGLSGVTLVGFGLGGWVAAELASMSTARLKGLVLVGAAGLQPREGEIMDEMLMDYVEYMENGFRDESAYHAVFGAEPEASVKELWDFSREMTARLAWKPYMFNNRLNYTLKDVDIPALIIHGAADRVVPPVCARQYAEAIPNARVEMIAGAGHNVEYEEPATVARLIADFAR